MQDVRVRTYIMYISLYTCLLVYSISELFVRAGSVGGRVWTDWHVVSILVLISWELILCARIYISMNQYILYDFNWKKYTLNDPRK